MDWFERLTGFREQGHPGDRLQVEGQQLRSAVNGRAYGIGRLELVSLRELREVVGVDRGEHATVGRTQPTTRRRHSTVRGIQGDVRGLHQAPEHVGALFQVASQFNLLEMIGPDVTPEQGVTRYESDRTQGPACAIAAGAATIYRNYYVPIGDGLGSTSERQFDGLGDLVGALGEGIVRAGGPPLSSIVVMRNGYALCTDAGLGAVHSHLASLGSDAIDTLRGHLRIGLHHDVEVTDAPLHSGAGAPLHSGAGAPGRPGPSVSQALCSALPVAYSPVPAERWKPFACLVLEAAYEATLLAGVLNARRGRSNVVLLTSLGGGAFGNHDDWICAAMRRALGLAADFGLDVRVVSYGAPSTALSRLIADVG